MSVKPLILAVAVVVLSASTVLAQGWHEYVSRDEFFLVGMPSAPQITSTTYRAASGALLPAKQFVATEGNRRYTVTVVHYVNASAEDEAAALEHAVRSFRNRPAQITYDRAQQVEGLPAHMIYMDVADAQSRPQSWALEGGSPTSLMRGGWQRGSIKPRDKMSVRCHRLRDGSQGCLLGFVTNINGTAMDKEFD